MIFLKEIEIGQSEIPSIYYAKCTQCNNEEIKQKLINYYSKMVLLRESILIKLKKKQLKHWFNLGFDKIKNKSSNERLILYL